MAGSGVSGKLRCLIALYHIILFGFHEKNTFLPFFLGLGCEVKGACGCDGKERKCIVILGGLLHASVQQAREV